MTILLHGCGVVTEDAAMREMFRERKRVFVDLLKWDVPVLDGQYELDQFDGLATRYIIIADPDGTHRGSMRLLPSCGPHLLGSIFPDLCEDGPPEAPGIWEISRFCLSPRLRARQRRVVRDQLVTAAVLFALDHAITAYSCVADMGWLSQILAFGWRCEPLGLPVPLPSGLTGAMLIRIDTDSPLLMAQAGTWAPLDCPAVNQIAA